MSKAEQQHWAEAVAECITDEQEALRIVGFYEDGEWQPAMLAIGRENLALRRDLAAAQTELERERMRLAACGVVAMANTGESAAHARQMHPDYMSASCQDVMNAVDREMALREEVVRLKARMYPLDEEPMCLVCGASTPCMDESELKPSDPGIPCTFDPTPRQLYEECKSLRARAIRAEDALMFYANPNSWKTYDAGGPEDPPDHICPIGEDEGRLARTILNTEDTEMKCEKCGREAKDAPIGTWFRRINAKGEKGKFVCEPSCTSALGSGDAAVIAAVTGVEKVWDDTARLDALQAATTGYGKGWILRESFYGRGMRLHETSMSGASASVREAIDLVLRPRKEPQP